MRREKKTIWKVERIETGLVQVVTDEGRCCWFEVLAGGVPEIGDTLQGDPSTLGEVHLYNKTRGTPVFVYVQRRS